MSGYTDAAQRTQNTGPLRRVVAWEMHRMHRLDVLECGHQMADYDCYPIKSRRRCYECATLAESAPEPRSER